MLTLEMKKMLKNYSLEITFDVANEIVILFGPSGAGKTTILNCIAGLTQPDSGLIKLNQTTFFDTGRKPLPIQKRNIGYLFQDYALFPHMTVWKNISYGMKDTTLTNQLIETVGIKHLLNSYPKGISGGEKQRVALVRALATEPQALLLDEPFSALDQETRIECQNELLRLHQIWNIPVIMVTHDLEEATKLGDRILQLEKGQIKNEQTPSYNE